MDFKYKQALVTRKDLNLSRGKLAVQLAHASVQAAEKAEVETKEKWLSENAKKVALVVKNERKLTDLFERAKEMGIPAALIKDAGLTEVEPGTITAVGIGPDKSENVSKLTGNLPLLD